MRDEGSIREEEQDCHYVGHSQEYQCKSAEYHIDGWNQYLSRHSNGRKGERERDCPAELMRERVRQRY